MKEREQATGENAQPEPRHPRSTWKHNSEGLSEAEMKAQYSIDRGLTRAYKQCHLKLLSPAIRQEIVRLYEKEHMRQSDIAQLYRVSN